MLSVTATELPRLMACNGSRLMAGFVPVIERDDTVRREGDAAHWYVEQVCKGIFQAEELVGRQAANGVYITEEMVEYVQPYLEVALSVGSEIEIDTSLQRENWEIRGRADNREYFAPIDTLYIRDFKYGWSHVEPEKNWTLLWHAIHWAIQHNRWPSQIILEIYQPRPHHPEGRIRSWRISGVELAHLYQEMLAVLNNPNDELHTGEHCYKCPALASCPAARKAEMNGIEASSIAFVDNLDNKELAFQLNLLDRASDLLKQLHEAYSELALHRIREGQLIEGYSIENKLSDREWHKHITPDFMKIMFGKDLTKKQLVTPAQAEKAGVAKDDIALFTERRITGVKLIRMTAHAKASKMFDQKGTK